MIKKQKVQEFKMQIGKMTQIGICTFQHKFKTFKTFFVTKFLHKLTLLILPNEVKYLCTVLKRKVLIKLYNQDLLHKNLTIFFLFNNFQSLT